MEPQVFKKKIFYIDPKTNKTKMRIQTWTVNGEEEDWEIEEAGELPGFEPELKKKSKGGRPKGSKNRRGTRVARKTREPKKKLDGNTRTTS